MQQPLTSVAGFASMRSNVQEETMIWAGNMGDYIEGQSSIASNRCMIRLPSYREATGSYLSKRTQ